MPKTSELSKYQKKTDREHILDNPDTYIGSVELINSTELILNNQDGKNTIERKQITYNPGLYKLFDEGIVNCRDHVIRMQQKIKTEEDNDSDNIPVTNINIDIEEDGTITMFNDGNGIDVAEHPEY